jgi:hypothetical protein
MKQFVQIKNVKNGHYVNMYVDQHLPLLDPPNFNQTGIFGLKIYHPATLSYGTKFVFRVNRPLIVPLVPALQL